MSARTIMDAAEAAGYRTFAEALQASGYAAQLEGPGPFTVFAPSDAAFKKFSYESLERLLHGDKAQLHEVMGYHVATGAVGAARFAGKRIRAVMQAGGDVIIDGRTGLRVNSANLIEPDLAAANGVIHGIDGVLWPHQAAARAG